MSPGDRLEKWAWWLDRRPALIVGLLAAVYMLLMAPFVHRHLSYDELHTFYIAQAPSVRQFVEQIRLLDLHPPLTYLLVRASMGILGPTELAARLPIMLASFLGSMGLLVFIARRVGPLWGAAGVGLFWCNTFFYYAGEARPYGILLGFFGLTLVSGDFATQGGSRRRWALAGVAAGATGMLLSHIFAPLWLMPFGVAELVRSWRERRIDYPLWGALTLPLVVCLLYIPLVQHVAPVVFPPQFRGSVTLTAAFYVLIFLQVWPALIVASLAAFAISFWRRRAATETSDSQAGPATGFEAPDLALLLTSLLLPALLNVVSVLRHIAFFARYGYLTVLTTNLLVLLFIAYRSRANRLSGLVSALIIFGFTLYPSALVLVRNGQASVARQDFDQVHPELPFVANSAFTFLEMDHYEQPALLARLYYLVDPESAMKYAQSNLTEGLLTMKQYFPIRANVSSYGDFAATHRHFLVWGETGEQQGWLLTKLKAEGAQVSELGRFDSPYPDSRLYEVTLKP